MNFKDPIHDSATVIEHRNESRVLHGDWWLTTIHKLSYANHSFLRSSVITLIAIILFMRDLTSKASVKDH